MFFIECILCPAGLQVTKISSPKICLFWRALEDKEFLCFLLATRNFILSRDPRLGALYLAYSTFLQSPVYLTPLLFAFQAVFVP